MYRGDGFVLLETLSKSSYRRAHLPGALLFDDVDKASELLPGKDALIITYCSNFN
jgi:hypothetical protein